MTEDNILDNDSIDDENTSTNNSTSILDLNIIDRISLNLVFEILFYPNLSP
jgi:hypothetical protein